ncbi:MAG: hypothetical protein NVSMB23_08890 [Myxococcales bacterium]
MPSRDPVAEIVAYNQPLAARAQRVESEDGRDLTAEALRRKLDALAASPFRFFRGTFHLMARDLLEERVPGAQAAAPEALIVGDLHLENFGVYRGASGALVFDVNDFDDVGLGPCDLDLKRLCASAFLLPGLTRGPRLAAARAIARGWADAIERLGARFPIAAFTADKAEAPLVSLLGEHGKETQSALIARVAPGKGHDRFAEAGAPAKSARVGKTWLAMVEKAASAYAESLKRLKSEWSGKFRMLDAVYRFKGTGSLGRMRFSLLLDHDGDRRIVEIKEARLSALDDVRGAAPPPHRAEVQTAAIRRLQGDPWPRVAATVLAGASALGREQQPEEEKIASDQFAAGQGDRDHAQLDSYASQCGEVLARMHCRVNAPQLLDVDWKPHEAARAAVEFAERYAAQVEDDQKTFLQHRDAVVKALGL